MQISLNTSTYSTDITTVKVFRAGIQFTRSDWPETLFVPWSHIMRISLGSEEEFDFTCNEDIVLQMALIRLGYESKERDADLSGGTDQCLQ